jgi:hypothetical protein
MSLSSALAPPAGAPDGIVKDSDPPSKTAGDGMDVLQKALHGAIERDSATGKSYLKIAMPEPDAMSRIAAGIGQLLSGLLKR